MRSRLSPGLPSAIAAGCICTSSDNMDGRGCSPHLGEPRRFNIETECPLHGFEAWPTQGEIRMRKVILESPFAGDVAANIAYARRAVRDCLARGESPIASHLLFTQDGILDDAVPSDRQLGIDAGLAWYAAAEAPVFYLDHGMSRGMLAAWRFVLGQYPALSALAEFRFLAAPLTLEERMAQPWWFRWETPFTATTADRRAANMPLGPLEVDRNKRAPTAAAAFQVRFQWAPVAFYPSRAAAISGAEHFYGWFAREKGRFSWPPA